MRLKIGRANTMIPDDEPFVFSEPTPPPENEQKLYELGFRPFGYEW